MSQTVARLLSVTFISVVAIFGQPVAANTQIDHVREIIQRALDEQHILLTCTHLESNLHMQLVRRWNEDLEQSQVVLHEAGIDLAEFEESFARAQPDQLILPPETPFGDVIELCNNAGDWHRGFIVNFQLTVMHREIASALED